MKILYIEQVIKQIPKNHYKSIRYDQGNEFKGDVIKVMNKNNVLKFINDPHAPNAKNSMSLIERFNYTLAQKIKKYLSRNKTSNYINVLDDLVFNYNITIHNTIKHKPIDVFNNKEYPMQQGLNIKNIKRKFKVGDYVRAIKKRKTFDKRGFIPTYTETVYKIEEIKNNKYTLNNGKQSYEEELIPAKENETFNSFKQLMDNINVENAVNRSLQKEFDQKNP